MSCNKTEIIFTAAFEVLIVLGFMLLQQQRFEQTDRQMEAELRSIKRTLSSGFEDYQETLKLYEEYKQSSPFSALDEMNLLKSKLKILQDESNTKFNQIGEQMNQLSVGEKKGISAIQSAEQTLQEMKSTLAIQDKRVSSLEKAPPLDLGPPTFKSSSPNSDQDSMDALCIQAFSKLTSRKLTDAQRLFQKAMQYDTANKGVLLAYAIIHTHGPNPNRELGMDYLDEALGHSDRLPSWFDLTKLPQEYLRFRLRNGETFLIDVPAAEAAIKRPSAFDYANAADSSRVKSAPALNQMFRPRQ